MKNTTFNLSPLAKAFAMTTAVALSSQAFAQEETEVKEKDVEKIQVTGSLGSLPGQDVESVFGFGKSILETPRSASTISQEQMERFNVSDIDELVAFAPGTFTQSFFGVAGSLDVRGTPGEVYFRGVRRLDNPGNYPTPIASPHTNAQKVESSTDVAQENPSYEPIHNPKPESSRRATKVPYEKAVVNHEVVKHSAHSTSILTIDGQPGVTSALFSAKAR